MGRTSGQTAATPALPRGRNLAVVPDAVNRPRVVSALCGGTGWAACLLQGPAESSDIACTAEEPSPPRHRRRPSPPRPLPPEQRRALERRKFLTGLGFYKTGVWAWPFRTRLRRSIMPANRQSVGVQNRGRPGPTPAGSSVRPFRNYRSGGRWLWGGGAGAELACVDGCPGGPGTRGRFPVERWGGRCVGRDGGRGYRGGVLACIWFCDPCHDPRIHCIIDLARCRDPRCGVELADPSAPMA